MTIQEFMNDHRNIIHRSSYTLIPDFIVRQHVVCKDGFSMSVQASDGHKSHPQDDHFNNLECVECAVDDPYIKDVLDTKLMDYLADWVSHKSLDDYLNSEDESEEISEEEQIKNAEMLVFYYVPIDLVQSILDSHGGINEELMKRLDFIDSFLGNEIPILNPIFVD